MRTPAPLTWRPANALVGLLVSACLLLTAGCQTLPGGPGEPETGDAETALSRGRHERAARAWEAEARQSLPDAASALWVRAADAWLMAGDEQAAENALRQVDRDDLRPQDRARLHLVLADLALRARRPDEADALLRKASSDLPADSKPRFDSLYGRLLQQLSAPERSELLKAAQISADMKFYDPLAAVEMMEALETVPSGELAIRAWNPRGDQELTGWYDLALVIRQNLVQPAGVTAAIREWKIRRPYHLLNEGQALDTWLRYRQRFAPPQRIAVLLPGAGRLQAAGDAIRDGLVGAWMQNPGGAELLFFPTDDDPQSAIAAWFSAQDAGVDWIVGPLRKESVEAMLGVAGLSTPVLALNDLPEDFAAPPGLSGQIAGLSLSQEAEVAAVAAQATASGYRNAVVLAPRSLWGERMATAFEADFLHGDQQIVADARFAQSQNDHSAILEQVLKIDESKRRKTRLENTLQTRLEFEPVRRDDVDVIFLAADSTQARLIRPQLRFNEAGDIPVYATGRVYSGQPDPTRNQDLDGLRFPTTPWQLSHGRREDMPALASIRGGSLASLHALGRDAWNILPWLGLMRKDPQFRFAGDSGYYRSGPGETLVREPAWAEFRGGLPEPLAPSVGETAGDYATR